MRVLVFPNSETIRLALSLNLIPPALARQPVRAARLSSDRILIEVQDGDFTPDILAALHRLGIAFGIPNRLPELQSVLCWAELLPLQPDPTSVPPGTPILLTAPITALAGLVAEIQRLRPQTIRLLQPDPEDDASPVWLLLDDLPPFLTRHDDSIVHLYRKIQSNIYLLEGWDCASGSLPAVAPSEIWLIHPDRPWCRRSVRDLMTCPRMLPLPDSPLVSPPGVAPPTIPLRLTLTTDTAPRFPESLWIFDESQSADLDDILRHSDERSLTHYQIATLADGGGKPITAVFAPSGEPTSSIFALVPGYVRHPVHPQLFLPTRRRLRPEPRPEQLARLLNLRPDRITWLTTGESGTPRVQSIPRHAFTPLATRIQYETRPHHDYHAVTIPPSDGMLPKVLLAVEADVRAATPIGPANPKRGETPGSRSTRRVGNWWSHTFGHWFHRSNRASRPPERETPHTETVHEVPQTETDRVRLRGTSDWTVQRLALEQQALAVIPHSSADTRGHLWAELGRIYTAMGNATDAAICRLSAVWEVSNPTTEWREEWFRAEAKSARLGPHNHEPEAFLNSAPDVQSARLAAACLVQMAGTDPTTHSTRIADLLARLDPFEQDLPIKAVWLARMAAARMAGGDPLSLARCRDRIFSRLTTSGPELELDLPSFLRFQGHAGSERFQNARDWLVRIREPLHRWIARHGVVAGSPTPGRLQWAGIDAEIPITTALADLMLAWGLSTLGDRSRSRQFLTQAANVLQSEDGADPDTVTVRRHLLARFTRRIATAQSGRTTTETDTPSPDEPAISSEFARYTIDKLVARTRSLDPFGARNPYRGRDFLLGHDALGESLHRWLERRDFPPEFSLEQLLEQAEQTPTADRLPRLVLVLLDAPELLTTELARRVLPLVVPALELAPEWLRSTVPHSLIEQLQTRFLTRMVQSAANVCLRFHQPESFERLIAYLLADTDRRTTTRPVILQVGHGFFRAVGKLGLVTPFEVAIRQCATSTTPGSPESMTAAIGWFILGNDTAGTRLLDAARERLFVSGVPKLRERTALATQYAAALGYAPLPVTLGRLEELVVRLDLLDTQGATNRFFTLQPLVLVDTIVNAIVGEDLEPGSEVRRWLDDEEFLIRRRITRDLAEQLSGNSQENGFSRIGRTVR